MTSSRSPGGALDVDRPGEGVDHVEVEPAGVRVGGGRGELPVEGVAGLQDDDVAGLDLQRRRDGLVPAVVAGPRLVLERPGRVDGEVVHRGGHGGPPFVWGNDARRRGSAERERKSLHARIEKLDLELSISDGLRLSDQLIQPLFANRAVASLVNVDSVSSARRLSIEEHAKSRGGSSRCRSHVMCHGYDP